MAILLELSVGEAARSVLISRPGSAGRLYDGLTPWRAVALVFAPGAFYITAQLACPQLQESSILSRAPSQYGPQYLLPCSGAQLQAGCAHLLLVVVCGSCEIFSVA